MITKKVIQLLISLFMKAVTVKCAECVIFIGFPVRQLKRIKLGNLTLQGLKRNGYRILNEDEINALIKAAAINE